ncbi:ROK family glucokinase [soil metagenome]
MLDEQGRVIETSRQPTPAGADALVDTVGRLLDELSAPLGGDREVTLGVGLPGSITKAGVITSSPHLPDVTEFDAAGALTDRQRRPVTVANDANCAVMAEWTHGAGRGVDDVIMITLGTGIGGGIIAGGRLLLGAHGHAGEFGHMMVEPDGLECPCGQRGCWERYASGSAVMVEARRRAAASLGAPVESAATIEAITSEQVVQLALAGDVAAMAVLDHVARWLAIGLANLTNAFDPARFVLGGGLSEAPASFEPALRREMADRVYASEVRRPPDIRMAELGERAGAIGAALLGSPAD